jgi:hypothetical protein
VVQAGEERAQGRQFLVEGAGALGGEVEPGSRSFAVVALADLDVAGSFEGAQVAGEVAVVSPRVSRR